MAFPWLLMLQHWAGLSRGDQSTPPGTVPCSLTIGPWGCVCDGPPERIPQVDMAIQVVGPGGGVGVCRQGDHYQVDISSRVESVGDHQQGPQGKASASSSSISVHASFTDRIATGKHAYCLPQSSTWHAFCTSLSSSIQQVRQAGSTPHHCATPRGNWHVCGTHSPRPPTLKVSHEG
jgi:hypothetical protein